MWGDEEERIYQSGYKDGHKAGMNAMLEEGYKSTQAAYDAGLQEGYAKAREDMDKENAARVEAHRKQIAQLLDIPHNPNRRPTKINTERSDALRKEETRRLLNGE